MIKACTHCGGELKMVGFEQIFGLPQSRRWHYACGHCGAVHELDNALKLLSTEPAANHSWGKVQPAVPAQEPVAPSGIPGSQTIEVSHETL
ncbi:MAG: hypothetical protein WCK05_16970 [Planctomycetota bacterium]